MDTKFVELNASVGLGKPALRHSGRICLLAAAVLFFLLRGEMRSQTIPSFIAPRFDPAGNLHLTLVGDAGASYVIETSNDLKSWSSILTNTTTGGILEFTQTVESNARFYRARLVQGGGGEPPAVIPVPDPTQRTVAVVTPAGGDLFLVDPTGVLYTLSFPTNAVSEPVEVSMTLVTNLVGQPFADTNWHAVVFEPSGLEFLEPARLTIQHFFETTDTNVASFWFSGDGTDFGLVPDRLFPDRVEFDLYHFSGAGMTRMTRAEYQVQTQRQVHDALEQVRQQFEAALKPLRDAGALPAPGQPLPPDVAARLGSYLDLWAAVIATKQNLFMSDCDYLRRSIATIRSTQVIRQRYALPDSAEQTSLNAIACAAIDRCSQQIVAQCKGGNTDVYRRLRQWESISARPLGCPTIPDSSLKGCLPQWYGTIEYSEGGRTVESNRVSSSFMTTIQDYSLTFSGVVTNAVEMPTNMVLTLWVTVDVFGTLSVKRHYFFYERGQDGCEADPKAAQYMDLAETSGGSISNVAWSMTFYQTTNAPLVVSVSPAPPLLLESMGSDKGFYTGCPPEKGTNWTARIDSELVEDLPVFHYPNGILTHTTNEISWFFTIDRLVNHLNTNVIGHGAFLLKRRP